MRQKIAILLGIAGIILIAIGVIPKIATWASTAASVAKSVSIIGGEDGPTAVFLAGKIGPDFGWISIIIGIVLLAVGIVQFKRSK